MAVRFKFRSSLNFDTVDIEGRSSISVRDLKSKIIRQKNLNICQDFDLVFSDSLTGQEYVDGSFQIPNGASVIIKRVPAGSGHGNIDTPHISAYENLAVKDTVKTNPSGAPNTGILDFDDFGVDLYPYPGATLSSSNLDDDKKTHILYDTPNIGVARYSKQPVDGCQKIEASNLSEASPRGRDEELKSISLHRKLTMDVQEDIPLEKVDSANPAMRSGDLPSELKCLLCKSFFKAAVMIPCCQHSFCEKCICEVLHEKGKCPKCFSTKCRVEDLLPNVSLRQAIVHFLESQILTTGFGNDYQRYAPDGESGIQAEDVSCGVSILQKQPELPHSPSGTGKGSNNIMTDSAYSSPFKTKPSNLVGANNLLKLPAFSPKKKQIDKSGCENAMALDEFQGESQPMHEEAESTIKKKDPVGFNTAGGINGIVKTGRNKKGPQTCFMCGSPDHFIRECPVALSPHSMLQAGNAIFPGAMPGYMPYWNRPPMPHFRPFCNLYGDPGMMPFNATMVPASPFPVPNYHSSMYGPIQAFGYMRMGPIAPQQAGEDHCLSHSEFLDVQDQIKRQKLSNEDVRREQYSDVDNERVFGKKHSYSEKGRSHDHKSVMSREKNVSYSDCSSSQRKHSHHSHKHYDIDGDDECHQKAHHSSIGSGDKRLNNQTERLSSEDDDMPCSTSWQSEKRQKHHHKSSDKVNKKSVQYGGDSSQDRYQTKNKNHSKRSVIECDMKRHHRKHHSRSELQLDQSSSINHRQRKKDAGPISRHSQHDLKSNNDEPSHERWQMISGSDEDGTKECRYYKRKRGH
ncbi:E3 ubiquitin ligase PARAQUAT TOLERANCE 3 isoform X2 [Ziziphus jujuba]|uniref:E3 ubiquitin ligase PARAQUAT TOLERANCE 3 isoform X2 n=1 Tax=Ziziphus jujuba TaxID=326968 RepID=A0A6P3ZWU6_ZIZJJ|nr:E3 ubiquitin ligase PARAQUAT TOLERANCE 3 isoform X2 [Ziziphus jujuba]